MQKKPEYPSKKLQQESEQGIIIFFSCSPSECALEIDEIQQGSFTYALLEALNNRREANTATVERLDRYLRQRVPEINQQYNKPRQTPYVVVVEPASMLHLILFPNQATLQDVAQLKLDALEAEVEGKLELAKQLCTRIIAVSPSDEDALKALERILLKIKEETLSLQTFTFETVTVNRKGEIINRETHSAQYFTEDLGNGIFLDMINIPSGKFLMGSLQDEKDSYKDERPQNEVSVPSFFMGKYPVTQAQWRVIASRTDLKVEKDLDLNPAYFKDRPDSDRRPVEQVSWYDAIEFCARLSKLTGREYRLPSEAEWEYACRAGTTTPFYFGETITGELANYRASETYAGEAKGEYREETTSVGQFLPNAFGLYDMHGNVWEWCADTWHDNYDGAPRDGSVWTENGDDNRSPPRGGSWCIYPDSCRSAYRFSFNRRDFDYYSDFGFRVVCGAGRTL